MLSTPFVGFFSILVAWILALRGLVLGPRIWIVRHVELTSCFRLGVQKLHLFPIDGATLPLATTTLGPRFSCRAQATPRVHVDVARHSVPLPVLLQVRGTHSPPFKTSGRFQVFVKGLAGHKLVIAGCSGDMLVDDFMELVAVPLACFCLVGTGSKVPRLGTTLCDARVVGHSLLFMVGRLRKGSSRPRPPPVPGSWHCYVCDMGGCWPSAKHVFSVSCAAGLCATTAKSPKGSA